MFVSKEGRVASSFSCRNRRRRIPEVRQRRWLGHALILGVSFLLSLVSGYGCSTSELRSTPVRDGALNAEIHIPGNVAKGELATSPANEPARLRLGESVRGTPIMLDLFGDGSDRILIVGGLHGDEPNGARIAERLIEYLRAHPDYVAGRTIGVVARANPDGLAARTRTNAHGVDLNRNFPTGDWRPAALGEHPHGNAPGSEPETRAIMTAVRHVRPQRLVDIHSILGGAECNNYDGPAGEIAKLMSSKNGYPVSTDIGYPTPGALGCWAGLDLHMPAITLELPRGTDPAACWRDNAAALLSVIEWSPRSSAAEPAGRAEPGAAVLSAADTVRSVRP